MCPLATRAQFTLATNDDAVTITGYTGSGGAVSIPSATNGYPIVSIGDDAFLNSAITSLMIPDSVTSIGYEAFGLCASLATVNDALNGITNIAQYAFFTCTNLTSLAIPSGVTILTHWK